MNTPASRVAARKTTPRGEQRRKALLDAARAVFLEYGYEGASLDEVMRRVGGGSKASLYSFFGSKRELFIEVSAAHIDQFMKDLSIPREADDDLAGTLTALGVRYLGMMLGADRANALRLLYAEVQRFPDLGKLFFENALQQTLRELGNYLAQQCAAGRLECADTGVAAAQFFALIRGQPYVAALLGLQPFESTHALERHVQSAVQLFVRGYSPS